MKKLLYLATFISFPPSIAWAELPTEIQYVRAESVNSDQSILTLSQQNALQERLRTAVFLTWANQPKPFELASTGITLDGACVAVHPDIIRDVLPPSQDDIEPPSESEIPENPQTSTVSGSQTRKSHSFFDGDLHRSTSPFHKSTEKKAETPSTRQYYLTTADWLTNSNSFEIQVFGQKVPAKLEYRDDLQNLAILSTKPDPRIRPVDIIEPEQHIPRNVFVLLSPNTIYESMTQHAFSIDQMHLYGIASISVKNGYPLFSAEGRLAGLSVGTSQTSSTKSTSVVHPGLLDRALHPTKYNLDVHEDIKVIEY